MIRKMKLLASLLAIALLATACGTEESPGSDDSPGDTATGTPGDEAQSDVTVRVAVPDFANETLDPALEGRSQVLDHLLQAYDTILEIGPDGELAPGIAESWNLDEEGRVWTFQLREGIQFHDDWGELTAEDVAFSLNRFMHEEAAGTVGPVLRELVERVEVVDDYTLEIHTVDVTTHLPYLLSPHESEAGIVFSSRYMLEEGGDDFAAQSQLLAEQGPVGSGPFRFVSHVPGDSYTYEAVEQHWRETPEFKTLEILLVPEPSTQLSMLRSGEVDLISIVGDQIDRVEEAGLEIRTVPEAMEVSVLILGLWRDAATDEPTSDVRVRRALSLAIDRQELLDTMFAGRGSLKTTPYNTLPATQDINEEAYSDWAEELNRYDPEEARSLLEEAGYADGFSGMDMQLVTLYNFVPDVGEYVASVWSQELGVDFSLETLDYGTFRPHFVRADPSDDFNAGEPASYASGYRFSAAGSLANFWRYENGTVQLINNPELDEIVNRITTIRDDEERVQAVQEAYELVNEEWVALPLVSLDWLYAVDPNVIGELGGIAGWPNLGRVFERMEIVADD